MTDQSTLKDHHILVLGAYGLIGFGIARHLLQSGAEVTGVGRSRTTAMQVLPDISWHIHDLSLLTDRSDWDDMLQGITAVVNCSGALQDGPQDRLETIHHHMVDALAHACAERGIHLVQISAVGATAQASTAFMTTKARGDQAIAASGVSYTLFRPGLVLAPHAYGGTALLRMLAAVPLIQPIAMPDAEMQTVALDDIAHAVCTAIQGKLPANFECDLVEDHPHRLQELVGRLRHWLGFPAARVTWIAPAALSKITGRVADGLGRLGWRSPLRSTALSVLDEGVAGDPETWRAIKVREIKPLAQTLRSMPATAEDRLYARMTLLMPILLATLAVFWALSGLIGFIRINAAAQVLIDVGWPAWFSTLSVAFWSAVDLGLAAAIVIRRYAKRACLAMIAVSVFYLAATTVTVPHLWLDPLGPMVKVLPSIALALVARAALETR